MKKYPMFSKLSRIFWVVILLTSITPLMSARADAPTAYAFPTFNTATITAKGAIYSHPLDVSSVPTSDFLFFTVSADYKHGTPASGWSDFMNLEITNGGSITYTTAVIASQGRLRSEADTTLYWSGVFNREYNGGGNITLNFFDTDGSAGGPYTSSLENVALTIYPSSTTSTSFTPFNTGTITASGAEYTKSIDVSHVPPAGYLFFTVVADWVHGSPSSSRSSSMGMQFTDGASIYYFPEMHPKQGGFENAADTTLYWTGILDREYTGGGNLTVKFRDTYSNSGGPYTSSLQNVIVSIYPSPTIPKTWDAFTTPDITGGEAGYTRSLDVSGLAGNDYLLYTVVADYKEGTNNAYSNTMWMEFNNGASTVYCSKTATQGAIMGVSDTTLYWSGVFDRKYTGGGNLSIRFWDQYTDIHGPFVTHLENVRVSIFRGAGTGVTAVHLTGLDARSDPLSSIRLLFFFLKDCFFNILE